MLALLRACHPEPTLAVTALMTALALTAGRGAGTVWVALAILAGQLSVGWSNDWVDRARDQQAGRQDKPIASGQVSARAVGLAAGFAAVACVPLSFVSGTGAGLAHVVGVVCAWAYNFGLKATAFSVVPYVVAFGLLPAFVTLGLPGAPLPPWWLVSASALMGAGAHFTNTLGDLDDDAATGIRGLPHRLGRRASLFAAAALMAGAVLVLALGPPGSSGAGAIAALAAALLCVGGVIVAGLRGAWRAGWRLTLLTAALALVLLLTRGASLAESLGRPAGMSILLEDAEVTEHPPEHDEHHDRAQTPSP